MMLLGFDLNSTRVRAVSGALGEFPYPVPLDPPQTDLPLMFSLEGRTPQIGAAALRLCRRLPHQVYQSFLSSLSEAEPARRTTRGRSAAKPRGRGKSRGRLDSDTAMSLVLQHLQRSGSESAGVAVSLPSYLSVAQVERLFLLAEPARLPLLGAVSAPLAAALAAYAEQPWFGPALLLDVDDHALTLSLVRAGDGRAELLGARSFSGLGLTAWRERLLNALADACIVQSRRDPRDTPLAEQMLFEQLDSVCAASAQGRMLNVAVQTPNWYQNLVLDPGAAPSFCALLARHTLAEVDTVLAGAWLDGSAGIVVLSAAAGQLPGLVSGVRTLVDDRLEHRPELKPVVEDPEEDFGAGLLDDFGDDLLAERRDEPASVLVLGEDASARAAHTLAGHFYTGGLPHGHLDRAAPLPLPQPVEAGPARIHYHGRDYVLYERAFLLGRHTSCDLVFDRDEYPMVAPRHCEIQYDQWHYLLHDRSREGTLVNDRPVSQTTALQSGDWIRLGASGPLVRFLGQRIEVRSLHTTA